MLKFGSTKGSIGKGFEICSSYASLQNDECASDTISLMGRIYSVREASKKLYFIDK